MFYILDLIVFMYENEFLTFDEIGAALGISGEYAEHLYFHAKKSQPLVESET